MTRFLGRGRLMAACLVSVSVLGACSSSSKPAVCTDVQNLQKSVQSLRDVSISKGALSTISTDVSQIKQQLATTKAHAKSQFSSEITQLSAAVDAVSTSFTAAKADPAASTLAALAASVKAVADATKSLQSAASGTC